MITLFFLTTLFIVHLLILVTTLALIGFAGKLVKDAIIQHRDKKKQGGQG